MHRLPSDEFQLLKSLFPLEPGTQTARFFIDNQMGEAHIDNLKRPRTAVIRFEEDLIIAGKPCEGLSELLSAMDFTGLLEIEPGFENIITAAFPEAKNLPLSCFYAVEPPALNDIESAEARWLEPADAPALESIGEKWLWKYTGSPESLIRSYPAAGTFVADKLTSVCLVFIRSQKYDNLAVATHPLFRGRGMASLASAFLTAETLKAGKTPVWISLADNLPSINIVRKMGYMEYDLKTRLYSVNWKPDQN